MQKPRQVPGISHLRQQFSPSNLPPIQSPMMPPQPIMEEDTSAEDLAQEIFVRMASRGIDGDLPNLDELRQFARHAKAAAQVYFEGEQS